MPAATPVPHSRDYLREFVTIVCARKGIIGASTVVIFAAALLVAFLWPPSYAVTGSILVKAKKLEKSPEALEKTQFRLFRLTKEDLTSETELILAPDLLRATILAVAAEGRYYPGVADDDEALTRAVSEAAKKLDIEVLPNSNIIRLTLVDRDRAFAETFMRHHLEEYVRYRNEVYSPARVTTFFEQQAQRFTRELKAKEEELGQLAHQTGATDPSQEISNNLLLQKDLELQLTQARTQARHLERQLAQVRAALAKEDQQLFSFIENPAINALSVKLQDLVIARQKKLGVYLPQTTTIRAYDEQVRLALATLRREVQTYADDLAVRLEIARGLASDLERQVNELRQRNLALNDTRIRMTQLQRDIGILKQSYEIFVKRWEEAKINTTSTVDSLFSISILGEPFCSGTPVFPNKRLLLPFGLLAGLFTGLCLAFLQEYFDHTIRTPDDVRRQLGLPVLFSLARREHR